MGFVEMSRNKHKPLNQMLKHICPPAAMSVTNKYSSPVPFVGLYMAAATLVCLILIVSDVCNGFRRRKLWLPCRYFSLNSVTLTLISIGSKIPTDLTTDMPSAVDQLSKLCGTVFICVAMGFMIPSIGNKTELDSYANITALTIFVVTVIVNVCMQIATGVIFSFIVEHSIILFCMLLLLIRYWIGGFEINSYMLNTNYSERDLFGRYREDMIARLEVRFGMGYRCNSQFVLACFGSTSGHVSLVCTTCFLLLTEAILGSLIFQQQNLKFCSRVSDYGWSIHVMLLAQFLTVTVATLALGFRWLSQGGHYMWEDIYPIFNRPTTRSSHVQLLYLFSLSKKLKPLAPIIFKIGLLTPVICIDDIIQFLGRFVIKKIADCMYYKNGMSVDMQLTHYPGGVWNTRFAESWAESKYMDAIKRTVEVSKKNPPNRVIQFWHDNPPSDLTPLSETVSCLSLVLLVEIAKFFPETSLHVSLKEILDEAFDVLYFIDKTVDSSGNRLRSVYTQIIWNYGLAEPLLRDEVLAAMKRKFLESSGQDISVLGDLYFSFYDDLLTRTFALIFFSEGPPCETWEILYRSIKQKFADILHALLPQLPDAIFNYIPENTADEEYEQRARFCLEVACKFEWVAQASDTHPTGIHNGDALPTVPVSGDACEIQEIAQNVCLQV